MKLDIRLPLGLLFLVFGLLLSGFGMASDRTLYQRSLQVNINLWWGLVMLGFGMVMLVLARRSQRRPLRTTVEDQERSQGASEQE